MDRRIFVKNVTYLFGLTVPFFSFLSGAVGMSKVPKIRLRKASDRGAAEHGWLSSRFSFSFANYFDPKHMGFRNLRVVNQDIVKPKQGFGTHGHKDMEIISYVISGKLKHRDSNGNVAYIKPGDIQRMTAGRGILHSEYNASASKDVHFLQIWLLPMKKGLDPGYDQKFVDDKEKRNQLVQLAGPDGSGKIKLNSNAYLYSSILDTGKTVNVNSKLKSKFWLQLINGEVNVHGQKMKAGDGASIENLENLQIQAKKKSHFILFDLA